MSKEKGNLRSCLSKTCHHAAPHKVRMILAVALDIQEELECRFLLITDNLTNAIVQLDKIVDAVNRGDLKMAREALNEPIEYGHNQSEPASKPA